MNACITGSTYEAAELFVKGALKPNFELKRNHHGRPPTLSTPAAFLRSLSCLCKNPLAAE